MSAIGICVICKSVKKGEKLAVLYKRGADTLNAARLARNDNILRIIVGNVIHEICRRSYCRKTSNNENKENVNPSLSENVQGVNENHIQVNNSSLEDHCFYCNLLITAYQISDRNFHKFCLTLDFLNDVLQCCEKKQDNVSRNIYSRVLNKKLAMVNLNGIYHQKCKVNFFSTENKGLSLSTNISNENNCNVNVNNVVKRQRGISVDDERRHAFLKAMLYLENNNEEYLSLETLSEVMTDNGVQPYESTHLKREIKKHFENVIFSTKNDKEYVILQSSFETIVKELFRTQNHESKTEEEKKNIVLDSAAEILRNDIMMEIECHQKDYEFEEITSEEKCCRYLPKTLYNFLKKVFGGKEKELKIASIGQAIVQATRPKTVIAPLQIGLSIQIHHIFPSRLIIDIINSLGFCSSYSEVLCFEKNAACLKTDNLLCVQKGSSVQFVADNADHNVCTLDGKGTFHGK